MPSKRIAVTPPMLADQPRLFDPLTARGFIVDINAGPYPLDDHGLAEFIDEAVAAIVGLGQASAEFFAACPDLRIFARNGVGIDNVDLDAATERGVLVTAPLGANSTSVAELTIGLLVTLVRRVIPNHNRVQQHDIWKREAGVELAGKTLGIIGLGRIGKKVATRALAFEMQVIANDIEPDTAFASAHGIPFVSKEELYSQADVVSLHVPLTPLTHHLLNEETIAQMKSGAYLVNTARGRVVDPAALATALDRGHIAGTALDVHSEEGQIDEPLRGRSNVITTTHLGAYTRAALRRTAELAMQSIIDILEGRRPEGLMNPAAWTVSGDAPNWPKEITQ